MPGVNSKEILYGRLQLSWASESFNIIISIDIMDYEIHLYSSAMEISCYVRSSLSMIFDGMYSVCF